MARAHTKHRPEQRPEFVEGRGRSGKHPSGALTLGDLVLDQARREVIVNGKAHRLTPKECRLLATFMQHPEEILTRELLMRKVWDTDYCDDTRTIEVHVCWLRSKIEEDTSNPQRILTVRGVGYMFSHAMTEGA